MIADLPHQGAVLGVGGEVLEPLNVVQRYFNDGSPGGGELVVIYREAVRLDVTAARVGRRVEIDHHRAFSWPLTQGSTLRSTAPYRKRSLAAPFSGVGPQVIRSWLAK
jgi:hypothetical protein